jgi:hypothetical protein
MEKGPIRESGTGDRWKSNEIEGLSEITSRHSLALVADRLRVPWLTHEVGQMEGVDPIPSAAPHFAGAAESGGN